MSLAQAAPLEADGLLSRPTGRPGTLPTPHTLPLLRNTVLDPNDLGLHGFQTHVDEAGGIVYTCEIGFLDLDHVRDAADWTLYLHQRLLAALRAGETELRFKGVDRSVELRLTLKRPLNPRERLEDAPALALHLARQQAFLLLTWHEVMTWFGYRTAFLIPERVSAFSYEDTISHAFGLDVAEAALAHPSLRGETAIDAALAAGLSRYRAQPRDQTLQAMEQVRGLWWDPHSAWPSNAFVVRRHLDIGLPDGRITPWRVPGLTACQDSAGSELALDSRRPGQLEAYQDFARVEIQSGMAGFDSMAFPGGRRSASGPGWIDARRDLPLVMSQIEHEVRQTLGERATRPD